MALSRETRPSGSGPAPTYRTFEVLGKANVTVAQLNVRSLLNDSEIDALDADLSRLIAAGATRLALNFASVGYMSSRVVGTLVKAMRACQREGGVLKLYGVQPHIAAAFAITKLERLIEFHLDELSCLRSAWPEAATAPPQADDDTVVHGVSASAATAPPEETPTPAPLTPLHVELEVTAGRAQGHRIAVKGTRFLIGRSDCCHLRAHSTQVGRVHAVIEVHRDRVIVSDGGSAHGTRLNQELLRDEEREARDGDLLEIGPLRFRLHVGRQTAADVARRPATPAATTLGPKEETESGIIGYLNPAPSHLDRSDTGPVRDASDPSVGLNTSGFFVSSRPNWDDEPEDSTPVAFRGVHSLNSFELTCPECNARITTSVQRLGQEHACPRCATRILVDTRGGLEVVKPIAARSGVQQATIEREAPGLLGSARDFWWALSVPLRIVAVVLALGLVGALAAWYQFSGPPEGLLARAEWVTRAVADRDAAKIRALTRADQRGLVDDWLESELEQAGTWQISWANLECHCQVVQEDPQRGTALVACQLSPDQPVRSSGKLTGEGGVESLHDVVPPAISTSSSGMLALQLSFQRDEQAGWLLDVAGTPD